jgi:hypothetical protein
MGGRYILNGTEPVEEPDLEKWAEWIGNSGAKGRRVARTRFQSGAWVSTVFLGLDHSFGRGRPLLFETMAFSAPDNYRDLICRRYPTWADAERGHYEVVRELMQNEREEVPE